MAIPVRHDARSLGASNYTLRKLLVHAANMMTGFTALPLQIASLIGFAFTLFGLALLIYVLVSYWIAGSPVPGFPFLASVISIFSGAQLFALGVIGEYLARMHFRMMEQPPLISQAGVAACRFLEWDSEFFGYRIARLQQSSLSEEALQEALAWCRRERIDCLYFLGDPDPATVALAEEARFRLVDVRITLEAHPQDAPPPSQGAPIRPSMPADISRLRSIAAASHLGSRFYRDGHFPAERCGDLYSTWIEQSCGAEGTQVLVAEFSGKAAGYVSCHKATRDAAKEGSIGLLGVADEAQNRGFGSNLVLHALAWFRDQRVNSVTVVTQGHNVAGQRLYQKSGFITRSEQLWYHYWPGGSPDGRDH